MNSILNHRGKLAHAKRCHMLMGGSEETWWATLEQERRILTQSLREKQSRERGGSNVAPVNK